MKQPFFHDSHVFLCYAATFSLRTDPLKIKLTESLKSVRESPVPEIATEVVHLSDCEIFSTFK